MAGKYSDTLLGSTSNNKSSKYADKFFGASQSAPKSNGQSPNSFDAHKQSMTSDPLGYISNMVDSAAKGLGGATDALTNGLFFGMGPQIAGLGAAAANPTDFGNAYDKASADKRAQMQSFSNANPGTSIVSELIGALLNPAGVGAGKFIAKGGSMLGRAARATGAGAAIGGAYGAGSAPPGERVSGGATGAALGGALGGAAVPAVEGLTAVGRKMVQSVINKVGGDTSVAKQKIASMAKDLGDGDIGKGLQKIQESLAKGGPDAVLADVMGIKAQKAARAAANVPGEGAAIADSFVNARVAGRGDRLQTAADTLGPRRNMAVLEQKRNAAKQMASGPFYDSAFQANQSVMSPKIGELLNRPSGKPAIKNAIRDMGNEGKFLSKADSALKTQLNDAVMLGKANDFSGKVGNGLKLETLDYVKKALWDIKSTMAKGGAKNSAGIVDKLRRELTSELDRLDATAGKNGVGDYARARAEFGKVAKEEDAVKAGLAFIKGDEDFTAQMLSRMSPGEKDAFRIGARKALSDLINVDTQSAINKFTAKKVGFWNKLKVVFPNETSFNKFKADIGREINKARTEGFVSPRAGSHTEPLKQDIMDMGKAPSSLMSMLLQAKTGNYLGAIGSAVKAPLNYLTRPAPGTARDLASMLLNMNPAEKQRILEQLGQTKLAGNVIPMLSKKSGRGLAQLLARTGAAGIGISQGQ